RPVLLHVAGEEEVLAVQPGIAALEGADAVWRGGAVAYPLADGDPHAHAGQRAHGHRAGHRGAGRIEVDAGPGQDGPRRRLARAERGRTERALRGIAGD